MTVAMWEHCTLDEFFDAAQFTSQVPLSLLISFKFSFLSYVKNLLSLLVL
jgi:hypothetical protein